MEAELLFCLSGSLKIGLRSPILNVLTAVRKEVGNKKRWAREKSLKCKKGAFVDITDETSAIPWSLNFNSRLFHIFLFPKLEI